MPSKKPAATASAGEPKRKSVSKSAKAGLTIPVPRVNAVIKRTSGMKRVGGTAPVYAAAVMEYILAEIVELAGNGVKKAGRKRINPEDVSSAIRGDKELFRALKGISLFTGDHLKNPSKALLPRSAKA
jgi:histone H2A